MGGSVKGLFKRKVKNFGRPDRMLKSEAKQWEKRADRFDMTPDASAQAEDPVMPMADEEEIKRSKRRSASARGGGRASTIFTDSDRLGP
jgi:hypothetical protein